VEGVDGFRHAAGRAAARRRLQFIVILRLGSGLTFIFRVPQPAAIIKVCLCDSSAAAAAAAS